MGSYVDFIMKKPLSMLYFMITEMIILFIAGSAILGVNIYWDRAIIMLIVWIIPTIIHIINYIRYLKYLEEKHR